MESDVSHSIRTRRMADLQITERASRAGRSDHRSHETESFGWRWESQRGSQRKAEWRFRRNFNLFVSGKRSAYESCRGAYKRTNACSFSSPCQTADQRASSRSSPGGSGGALTLALNRAAQHIGPDLIGHSPR